VDLVSGPGGLASFLRRRQLAARLGGPSLPPDVGVSRDIPAAIRHAVILRDQHCRWTGGCDQPASACEVHHLTHEADGGKTSVRDCILFCLFHHKVIIHQMGWTVLLNPDGTATAWNPGKTKILHSHSPKPAPGNTPGRIPGYLLLGSCGARSMGQREVQLEPASQVLDLAIHSGGHGLVEGHVPVDRVDPQHPGFAVGGGVELAH